LIQQLECAIGPTIRLTRKHQNHIGRLRSVNHEQPACIRRKHHEDSDQQKG
jgi:hypothetical protein